MEVEANGLQDSLESNEIEKRKVGLMRARVESADPSSKVLISPDSPFLFPVSFSLLLTRMGTAHARNTGSMECEKGNKKEKKRKEKKTLFFILGFHGVPCGSTRGCTDKMGFDCSLHSSISIIFCYLYFCG